MKILKRIWCFFTGHRWSADHYSYCKGKGIDAAGKAVYYDIFQRDCMKCGKIKKREEIKRLI
jgi:hypothetical protein